MKTAFLIGRIVVGGFYLFNGVNLVLSRAMVVPFAAAKGVPLPELAVPAAGALLLIGGLSILLGWKPVVGIGAIVLFLIPVSIYMHPFWSENGAQRLNDTVNFTKNLTLLASALMFAAIPRPWIAGVDASRGESIPGDLTARREPRRATGG
jgi:putative oxidoreductase